MVVANLGGASPSKDFHTLRAALVRLSKRSPAPNFDIVVVGREGPCERFGAITVHHRAHCASRDHLALYYQAGDFLLNPTHEETFSNVLAEAMCCGLPVLATEVAAVGEIVSGNQTGLLVPARDVEALVLALDRLSRDDRLRRTLAGNAAARAKELFSIDKMIDNYIAVFEELAARQVTERR
jgi:glycosyltransferase involved in cell wall biosynthesis